MVSITADRAQTTRHRVLAVLTRPDAQLVLVDSPGYQTRQLNPLNQLLNRTAQSTAQNADVVVIVAQVNGWTSAEDEVLKLLPPGVPAILALNKVDTLRSRNDVLPIIAKVAERAPSAEGDRADQRPHRPQRRQAGLGRHRASCRSRRPIYDEDTLTDRPERFFASELIREKLFRLLGDELPYESTVVIDSFEVEGNLRRITASIVVERRAHKPMILGKGGERIKRIASEARQDMEKLFGGKVFLTVWVQVRGGWSKDAAHLRSYGYE